MISALIVDDEAPARRKLRRFLAADGEIHIAGEASCGREAIAQIEKHRPNLVFLDVQMPDMDGFAVLDGLSGQPRPHVIFVTAHDHHACRAFEVEAINYLLKPVDPARFEAALERAKRQIVQSGATTYSKRILVNTGKRVFFLPVEQIAWVEAERNYIHVHAGQEVHVVRSTIEGFYEKLDPAQFSRINRSQIVNLDSIREMQPWFHGEYRVILKDGAELTWSRRFAPVRP
jgi:two-component system LytT family response regulator